MASGSGSVSARDDAILPPFWREFPVLDPFDFGVADTFDLTPYCYSAQDTPRTIAAVSALPTGVTLVNGVVTIADTAPTLTPTSLGFSCDDGTNAPVTQSLEISIVADNGYIVFAGATCSRGESEAASVTCTRHRRIFSSEGSQAASVEVTVDAATTCDPSAYTFTDPQMSSWTAGTEGNVEFNLATGAVSADCNLVLKFQALSNIAAYTERQTTTITILNSAPPASAETYYISTTGNDSNDGLTPGTAWLTLGRANSVPAAAGGDILFSIAAGTYRTSTTHIYPTVGGTDATHQKNYCPSGGNVTLRGPTSGSVQFVNIFENGVGFVNVNYDCPEPQYSITLDGECTAVRGGQSTGCHIREGTNVLGQDLKLCYNAINTRGYTGFNISVPTANRVSLCGSTGTHGSPVWSADDTGDTIYFNQSVLGSQKFLIDGALNAQGYIDLDHGGHATIEGQGGSVTVRNVRMDNDWSDVPGFVAPDGNRAAIFNSRSGADWVVGPNVLINRTGKAQDQAYQEGFKCEGQRTGIHDSVFRNAHAYFMVSASAAHSRYAEDCAVSHSVFDNGGPIALIQDYCDASAGLRRMHGFKFKNILARNVAKPWNPSYANTLFVLFRRCSDSYAMTSALLEVDGLTVQDTNCSRLGVYVYPSPGFVTMATAISTWPDMFKNYTCTADADLDNAPADATDLTIANMVTAYTPVNDTESVNQGVALTTTNGSGSSSTSLAVHNGCYFDDPYWGSFTINIEGVGDRTVTAKAVTGTAGSATACRTTYTLSAAATWADGADVNFPFTGAAPDRGVTH